MFPILIHLWSLPPLSRSRGSSRRNTRRRRGLAKEGNGGGGTAGRGRYGGAEHAEILMARSPAKAAAVRPRLGGIPNPLPALRLLVASKIQLPASFAFFLVMAEAQGEQGCTRQMRRRQRAQQRRHQRQSRWCQLINVVICN